MKSLLSDFIELTVSCLVEADATAWVVSRLMLPNCWVADTASSAPTACIFDHPCPCVMLVGVLCRVSGAAALGLGASASPTSLPLGVTSLATLTSAAASPSAKIMLISTGRLAITCEPVPTCRLSSL